MSDVVSLQNPGLPLDRRGRELRDLRISVMDRCNFRCPYCMPKETFGEGYRFLGASERLSFAEITRLASLFSQLGVRKLRLTGGEPLLRAGLGELVGDLAALPGIEDVALTTNGVLLAKHAAELHAQGLRRVTVSLDSLDPEVFRAMSGGYGDPNEIVAGIETALAVGLAPIKINCVVKRGVNDHTVLDLVERFRETRVIVRLIEYMDVGNRNHWNRDTVVSSREMRDRIAARWPIESLEPTYTGEVAERYRFLDGGGEVGFISSVSQPFCGGCTRARLSSEGVLYTCLFATHGLDLRRPIRDGASDHDLRELLRGTWQARTDRYSEIRADGDLGHERKIEMYYIGG
jgi:cyclic pyranopterin phosphate synthase